MKSTYIVESKRWTLPKQKQEQITMVSKILNIHFEKKPNIIWEPNGQIVHNEAGVISLHILWSWFSMETLQRGKQLWSYLPVPLCRCWRDWYHQQIAGSWDVFFLYWYLTIPIINIWIHLTVNTNNLGEFVFPRLTPLLTEIFPVI